MKLLIVGVLTAMSVSSAVMADQVKDAMQAYLNEEITGWITDPVIVEAIKKQNSATSDMDQTAIENEENRWRTERYLPTSELIDGVLKNEAAAFLRTQVAQSGGAITEVIVMDALGLNVAASVAPSDYWQGDEPKYTQTYAVGSGAHHFGDVVPDASTGAVQSQISVAISDPESGAVIGAISIGVSINGLM